MGGEIVHTARQAYLRAYPNILRMLYICSHLGAIFAPRHSAKLQVAGARWLLALLAPFPWASPGTLLCLTLSVALGRQGV